MCIMCSISVGIQPYELDYFISEVLSNEFDLLIDDGSLTTVSNWIKHLTGCSQITFSSKEMNELIVLWSSY